MAFTLDDLATRLNARLEGNANLKLSGAAEPAAAGPDDLALAMRPEYASGLRHGKARAAILWQGADWRALGLEGALYVQRPRYAMALATQAFDPGPAIAPGIHPTAIIDPSAKIGDGAAIAPFVVIGADVKIGAEARIASHVSIGARTHIGEQALLMAGLRIQHDLRIGDRFIGQPNAVIGGDGFAFVTPELSGVEVDPTSLHGQGSRKGQNWTRIHSLGSVILGDDVEVGANSCIDRGSIRATEIGDGCKLDALVMVGHNVVMGRDCLVAGNAAIGGSTVLGDRCVLGGDAALADNLHIGSDVVITGACKVASHVPNGRVMAGYPAVRLDQHVQMYKTLRRLSRRSGRKTVSKPPRND